MTSILKVSEIQDPTNSNTALTIDASGVVTQSAVPAFHAYGINNGTYTTTGTMPFNSTLLNNGNHYNTSTYTFTAPVSGIYFFTCMLLLTASSTYVRLYKNNGSDVDYMQMHGSSSSGWSESTGTALVQLDATNTVRMHLTSGGVYLGGTSATNSLNSFTGHLVG